ncbi:MAG: cation-translocating P-type ATPase [Candidatus Nanohaloarchaea archaeon]
MEWHSADESELFEELGTDPGGLTQEEAERRLEKHGENSLEEGGDVSPVRKFISQFRDFLIYLLVAAAAVSVGVGFLPGQESRLTEAALILLILVLNGIFGFFQDYRAEKSIRALRKMSSPKTRVLRDGEKKEIGMEKLVPGDVVFLEPGDSVPADARVLESDGLDTDESALTGESHEVDKSPGALEDYTPLAERTNMVFMNTNVVNGSGKAAVVDTGMETEVGGIAEQLNASEDKRTGFQEELDDLGNRLGAVILGVILVITGFQLAFSSASLVTVFLAALSLAVAANPVGLPAAVTLALATGSRKMLEKDVLVRRLSVIESLGSVDVIITDKTGTLTEGSMTVKRLYSRNEEKCISGEEDGNLDRFSSLLRCGLECNNAEKAPETEEREFYGDPTEAALLVSAGKAGMVDRSERIREIPFSPDRKRMTVVSEERTAFMKGAPEVVLERSGRILGRDGIREMTEDDRKRILEKYSEFGDKALRTLGFAFKQDIKPESSEEEIESEMVFLGLQGMIDPPREGVSEAVEDCRNAGIEVVMATGDDSGTAEAIGGEIGISGDAMETSRLKELSAGESLEKIRNREIFARVTPEDKVKILEAHREAGKSVAMTGNGVNDAPALESSDIGIAMGERGTDVAQQSSDMVIQDDNFSTIRDGIKQGRSTRDNIRNSVNYLLSGNIGEVMTVFFGLLLGGMLFPEVFRSHSEALVLTPMMLLWVNFISDGFPALALSTDPPRENIMQDSGEYSDRSLLDRGDIHSVLLIGSCMALSGMPVFFLMLDEGLAAAQSAIFTFLIVVEMVRIQAIRSRYGHSLLDNAWVAGALGFSLVLQLLLLYTPVSSIFGVVPLDASTWMLVSGAAAGFAALLKAVQKALK